MMLFVMELVACNKTIQVYFQFSTMPRTKKHSPSRVNSNQSLSLVKNDILNDKPSSPNSNAFEFLTRNLSFSSDFNNDSLNNNEEQECDTYKVPVNNTAVNSLAENYNEISINSDGQLSTLQGKNRNFIYVKTNLRLIMIILKYNNS